MVLTPVSASVLSEPKLLAYTVVLCNLIPRRLVLIEVVLPVEAARPLYVAMQRSRRP